MKTILIIEDDQDIRETLKELVEYEGYESILAENGEHALEFLSRPITIDLILLDLSMPVMDGKTFLKTLAEKFPAKTSIPVLIMTAAGPGEIPQYYDREKILRKPLSIDTILEKIARAVEKIPLP